VSYDSRVYHEPTDFGPDPVVVLVVRGTHEVSRFVHLFNGAPPTIEQLQVARKLDGQLCRDQGGRAALDLLAAHGGPDFRVSIPGVDEWVLRVLQGVAEGHTVRRIAKGLGVTPQSVSMRMSRACKRAGAASSAHLLALCAHAGLIEPAPLPGGDR
jgi:DNA-binding CsgD family transcriptional regulator